MMSLEEIYNIFLNYPQITTDSRTATENSIFFALKGEQFDGNQFASVALQNGAAFAVVDDPLVVAGKRFILVPDVLKTLQGLAEIHRRHFKAKVIGITGSNGKTTTKELVGKVLASTFNTVITAGNLNNHIGVPLSMLTVKPDTEFAVIEMGANHIGEIAELCRLAQPGYGIITNIGKAHLEGFGGFPGVIKAKSELYDFLRLNNGLVFLNSDNNLLVNLANGMNTVTFGSDNKALCTGTIKNRDPFLSVEWRKGSTSGLINSRLYGDYNFENIMAAVAVGLFFGVDQAKINSAIENYIPENNRSQVLNTGKNRIILDAYNANPSSMKAALETFSQKPAENKMVILGDMMELGDQSMEEHRNIIDLIEELDFDKVIYIGEHFCKAISGNKTICFPDTGAFISWLASNPVSNRTILLKGSRKMRLETLINLL